MLLRFIDGTDSNTGQRLDNVNRTHLFLASGKLVQQKCIITKTHLDLDPEWEDRLADASRSDRQGPHQEASRPGSAEETGQPKKWSW